MKIGQVIQKFKDHTRSTVFHKLITRLSSPKYLGRLWGPLSLLLNRYRCYSPRVKRPGRHVDPSPPPSAEIKKHRCTYAPPTTLHSIDRIDYFSLFSLRNKSRVQCRLRRTEKNSVMCQECERSRLHFGHILDCIFI